MLVISHKDGTFPGTEKEVTLKSSLNFEYVIEPKKYLLHNLYKRSLTIISIISIKNLWL